MVKSRNYSLDLVRIFAFFSVIGVHFFLNSGFYSQPVNGTEMLIMCIVRSFFMICVPLFIMLTGYLMSGKKWSLKYYRGITKTLGIYVLISIACVIYKITVMNYDISLQKAFFGILNFTNADYSWYIEMYIGLFLLAPFINSMYHGLESHKAKLALVITLLCLTAIPAMTNIYNFDLAEWWAKPSISYEYQKLLPDWWTMIYPVTYYCIGAYLREFPIKINRILTVVIWITIVIAFGAFNFYRCRESYFAWGKYTEWYSLPVALMAILAFTFISGIKTDNLPAFVKRSLVYLSDISLGAYLLSSVADHMVYSHLNKHVPEMLYRFNWFFPAVLTVAFVSLFGSAIINLIWTLLTKLTALITTFIKKNVIKSSDGVEE